MAKKRGRPPKTEPRTEQYRLRLDKEERAMLERLSMEYNLSMSEILRRGLQIQYNMAQFLN